MCGIACIVSRKKLPPGTLESFTDAVVHRGPDGKGLAKFAFNETLDKLHDSDDAFFVGLGHRRLSILDLSEAGSQPMTSSDESCVISYNGEIYNFIEIRSELEQEGIEFSSGCDTEVVLAAYQMWGVECFSRFNGMWAMVILDRGKKQIVVSRDRFGIKPLYCLGSPKLLAFASEIKQFTHIEGFSKTPNPSACAAYLANGSELQQQTFWKGIVNFPAANFATIDLNDISLCMDFKKYWMPENIVLSRIPVQDAVENIVRLFSDSVRLRLRSDVPVGSCLSGGLDSSSIFLRMASHEPGKTFAAFSACFDDKFSDEREFMKEIVEASPSEHVKVFPAPEILADSFVTLLGQHDEPFGSASIFAQFMVMQAARRHGIPVLLDGQGGDELFSGYWQTYFLFLDFLRKKMSLCRLFSDLVSSVMPAGNITLIPEAIAGVREFRKRAKMHFQFSVNHSLLPERLQPHYAYDTVRSMSPRQYRLHELLSLRLPRLLKWEDRNSMAFSVESRVPFLDVKLVEFVLSLPPEMNMRSGWTKFLFRKAMADTVPRKIVWRKDKKGFETPQDKWMKSGIFHQTLMAWADDRIHPVSDFISTPFCNISEAIRNSRFDSNSVFRLFSLDKWLQC
ncbi:MAG: asparagine synthase (glutamine-hydrolyzing) [Victivallales bacterium]|nr:asparagine synthase (glutamine-hydrolyzing) [Victivallales bacterium]